MMCSCSRATTSTAYAATTGCQRRSLNADADSALVAYPWPGNVRELANLMERVALLSDGQQIAGADLRLPRTPRVAASPSKAGETVNDQMDALERARIEEALRADGWNISRAAARLGLPRNTLRYRMERHGISDASEGATRRHRAKPLPSVEASPQVRWLRARITLLHARFAMSDAATVERARAHPPAGRGCRQGERVRWTDCRYRRIVRGCRVRPRCGRRRRPPCGSRRVCHPARRGNVIGAHRAAH